MSHLDQTFEDLGRIVVAVAALAGVTAWFI